MYAASRDGWQGGAWALENLWTNGILSRRTVVGISSPANLINSPETFQNVSIA